MPQRKMEEVGETEKHYPVGFPKRAKNMPPFLHQDVIKVNLALENACECLKLPYTGIRPLLHPDQYCPLRLSQASWGLRLWVGLITCHSRTFEPEGAMD